MKFWKNKKNKSNKKQNLKNNPEFQKEYKKAKANFSWQDCILAGISMISFLGIGICALLLLFNIISARILIIGLLLVIIFIMSTHRMVKTIVNSESKDKH